MEEKRQFSERLRAALQARKLEASAAVLEREFGRLWFGQPIRRQTAWKWLNGQAIPRQDKLQALAQWLKLDPHELRFGIRVAAQRRAEEKRFDDALSYAERDTLNAFLQLTEFQRKLVRELIQEMAKANKA